MEVRAKVILDDSRRMLEVEDNSVQLVLTSPPYYHIKDYGVEGQIGYGQSLHEYLKDLYRVWKESYRVLEPGRRLVINIGDQFARAIIYGRYKVIPLHAEVIAQCEDIGFDYMGAIIWQKRTTMRTTGGANVMGSYPYPPNGMVEIDYEYILIFKKPGKGRKVPREIKERSRLSKEEWKEYFQGHWYFGGARQIGHEAMFPEELPKRIIKMFSFVGETVLDPFLGSGTTAKVALELGRNAIGYEINPDFLPLIEEKLKRSGFMGYNRYEIVRRAERVEPEEVPYTPRVKDVRPKIDPKKLKFGPKETYKAIEITEDGTIVLNSGLKVRLRGVVVERPKEFMDYLRRYVLKREVYLKFDRGYVARDGYVEAYVYLKNRIFVNAYLIKSGIARAERGKDYDMREKFIRMEGRRGNKA